MNEQQSIREKIYNDYLYLNQILPINYMKMKMKPVHESTKRKFPSYIINSQFIPQKIQLTTKVNQLGKTIIFSDNPQLLRKMNEMKKKTMGTSPNKVGDLHHEKQSTDINEPEVKKRYTHRSINMNDMWNMEKNNEEKEKAKDNNEEAYDFSKNVIMNKDFKSKKMNEYMMKRNLYLPKIKQLLKNLPPRYDRQNYTMKNKTSANYTKTGNNCMFVELSL